MISFKIDRESAEAAYRSAGNNIKVALVMNMASCSKEEAQQRLASAKGFVSKAIE